MMPVNQTVNAQPGPMSNLALSTPRLTVASKTNSLSLSAVVAVFQEENRQTQ
jgi:hypothetical protein